MTLQARINDLITDLGTDYKQFKTWLFGSTNGSLADLTTTNKTSIVAAINEAADTGGTGATNLGVTPAPAQVTITSDTGADAVIPAADSTNAGVLTKAMFDKLDGLSNAPDATETTKGLVEFSTDAETLGLVSDSVVVTPGSLGSITNVANGLLKLGGDGKAAAAQLPSYVDDIVEVANFAALPATGEAGKIYVTLDNNLQFRWGGSAYSEISPSPGSTDAVPEGVNNLYYTQARVDDRITALIGDPDADLVAAYATAKA